MDRTTRIQDYELENSLLDFYFNSIFSSTNSSNKLFTRKELMNLMINYERSYYSNHMCCTGTVSSIDAESLNILNRDSTTYVDIQGLSWNDPEQRANIFNKRSLFFKSYTNFENSIEMSSHNCTRLANSNNEYWYFNKFFIIPNMYLNHFQLRNLVAFNELNEIIYVENKLNQVVGSSDFNVKRLNPINSKQEVIFASNDFSNDYGDEESLKVSTLNSYKDLVISGLYNGTIIIHNKGSDLTLKHTLTTNPQAITNFIDINSQDNELLISSNDGKLRFFSLSVLKTSREIDAENPINCLTKNPLNYNQILLAGDRPESVIIDKRSNRDCLELTGHRDYSFSCDWNPNGYLVATGNQDSTVKLYDLRYLSKNKEDDNSLKTLGGKLKGAVRNLKFDLDGNFLAFGESLDNVYCINLQENELNYQSINFIGKITGLNFIRNQNNFGQLLSIGISDECTGGILQYAFESSSKVIDLYNDGEFI
ncbi:hypothetical protein PACTADRAFT_47622 [Pachysolen tannophilus NRRL Y-2460]|uniref:Uncharacterized protein n=1 Tax=Pachysolen tannophilus NRRL Y-2460 TaxID=669874 RepID=A0A1E4U1A5_PACTA|nr:hypothetical protein PACTADRAFT_47622 [Pachysolen tannophilus NRRL Y-2460]